MNYYRKAKNVDIKDKKYASPEKYVFPWTGDLSRYCLLQTEKAKLTSRKVAGILCDYIPFEIIMASGAIPVFISGYPHMPLKTITRQIPPDICPLMQSNLETDVSDTALLMKNSDLLIAEATANNRTRIYEILGKKYPIYVLELPERVDNDVLFQQWVMELRKFKTILEQRFRTTITRQRLRWAIKETNRQRHLIKKIMDLMRLKEPPLTGLELLKTIAFISSTPGELDKFEKAAEEMMKRKIKTSLSQRKRVILTGISIPKFGEKIVEIIENNGGLVVARDNCTGIISFLDDINPDVDDPILVLAEKYKHAPCPVQKAAVRQTEILDSMGENFSPDCVIEVVWQTCEIYSSVSQSVSDHVQKTLKLPYHKIEIASSSVNTRRIAAQIKKFLTSL